MCVIKQQRYTMLLWSLSSAVGGVEGSFLPFDFLKLCCHDDEGTEICRSLCFGFSWMDTGGGTAVWLVDV